jgi:hypothetical protein
MGNERKGFIWASGGNLKAGEPSKKREGEKHRRILATLD